MTQHVWGPSRLNHGSQQCKHCSCTYEEALHALGMTCFRSPHPESAVVRPVRAYKPPRPSSEKTKNFLLRNLEEIATLTVRKFNGDIR